MATGNPHDLRAILLEIINDEASKGPLDGSLQSSHVLRLAAEKSGIRNNDALEQALLTQFYELFRTGYLAWGLNIMNPNPPFFHLTEQGNRALETYSRDPGNPQGYFTHIASIGALDSIAFSYLEEAVKCYTGGFFKAAAVMVGCAAERLVLELRDKTEGELRRLNRSIPKGFAHWKARTVANALQTFFEGETKNFDKRLQESFAANWSAFAHQIRTARNDAGHPASIDPVTPDTVHGSLLIFPEFAKLQNQLCVWVATELK